jgi:hypothetical protein
MRAGPRHAGLVGALLRAFDVSDDFAFLNLDIDSFELAVADAMIREGYRPRVISMEINERIPPPVSSFAVSCDPAFVWGEDAFYGCSISAAVECLTSHDDRLIRVEYNNAVFVRHDRLGGLRAADPAEAYRDRYAAPPDRPTLFPWQRDYADWLTLPPSCGGSCARTVRFTRGAVHPLGPPLR